jgi:predicted transcriptional regulator
MLREAVAQFVDREETRDQFQQEALAAWTEYRQTGRHLTGDEVQAALAGWGTEAERELPDCHG